MKTKKVPLAKLVTDLVNYPRNKVDDSHIGDLVRAIQSGQVLPPIIAEEKSYRIADGVHRFNAYRRVLGDEGGVDVELRKYADDAAFFLDAVALNSSHGRKLDRHDQTRIVLRLRELNVADQQIAVSLHVPEPTITTLSLRVVTSPSGEPVPAKRGLEHMRGQTLTSGQVAVMGSVRSAEAGRLALELTRLLEADMVDLHDEAVRQRLTVLAGAIQTALASIAA